MSKLAQAFRALAATPAFTAVVLVTLALAIGAGSAVFSVVDAVLLRPLRYPNASELVLVRNKVAAGDAPLVPLSIVEVDDVRRERGLFRDVAAFHVIIANVTGAEGDERVHALASTPEYFDVLGSRAILGRTFQESDRTPGYGATVVLSHAFWKRRYGGDPRVLGQKLTLDEDDYVVVGVMGPDFQHPSDPEAATVDVFLPCGFRQTDMAPEVREDRRRRFVVAVARLAPGVTAEGAQARLDAMARRWRAEYPGAYLPSFGAAVQPLAEEVVAPARRTLGLLVAAVAAVLFMACANVASLLLARGDARRREVAIRAALGASRTRIGLEVLVESLVLSLAAGALGLLLALWGTELLVALAPRGIPRTDEVQVNERVLLFTLAVSVATGVLFGVVPALQATRIEPQEVMKEGSRATFGKGRAAVLRALVTAELAIAVVLLASTGILIRDVQASLATDPGFDPAGVTVARMWVSVPNDPTQSPYFDLGARAALGERLRRAFVAIPGVTEAALASHVPIVDGRKRAKHGCVPAGVAPERALEDPESRQDVDPGYFPLMRVPMVAGRNFGAGDVSEGPRVVIASEGWARKWFGSAEAAVGKTLSCPMTDHKRDFVAPHTVVGVVADVRHAGLRHPPPPAMYYPMTQTADFAFAFLVRHSGLDRDKLAAALSAKAHGVEPAYPLVDVSDVEQGLAGTVAPRRFTATVLGFFAAVAFALATMGTYGAASFAVGQRREEIGLRVALGSPERKIVESVVAQTIAHAAPGAAIGLALTFAIHGVRAADTPTLLAVATLLAGAAAVAAWFPATRASRATPVLTLRRD